MIIPANHTVNPKLDKAKLKLGKCELDIAVKYKLIFSQSYAIFSQFLHSFINIFIQKRCKQRNKEEIKLKYIFSLDHLMIEQIVSVMFLNL